MKKIESSQPSFVKTGIQGLDALLHGGLPARSFVLVSGTPGTGKTILSLQYLLEGAKQFGEHGLFISFEQDVDSLVKQSLNMGYTKQLLDAYVTFVHYPVQSLGNASMTDILQLIKRKKAKRFVLDSITTLAINAPVSAPASTKFCVRKFIYTFVQKLKSESTTTALIISQAPSESVLSYDGVVEFLCDGIFHCRFESMGGENSRSIQVRKMRSIKHQDAVYPLHISSKGVRVDDS